MVYTLNDGRIIIYNLQIDNLQIGNQKWIIGNLKIVTLRITFISLYRA